MCIGKTLGENIAKVVVPIVAAHLDFKFKRQEFYEKKPPNELSIPRVYEVFVYPNDSLNL